MANTLELGNGKWATGKDTVLAFNDQNNNFKPLPFSFSRASSATVVNKDGLIETVGSGEPRIDFKDNTKGALLLEPERRNLVAYSEDFSNSWWNKQTYGTGVEASVITTTELAPDGSTNAFLVTLNSGSGTTTSDQARINKSIVDLSSGLDYTESIYLKGVNGGEQVLLGVSNIGTIKVTLTTEWKRFILSGTSGGGFNGVGPLIRRGLQEPLNSYAQFYMWGSQLEQGSYATSYIPTSGSAVTRVVDTCIQTVPEGIVDENEMTLYCELEYIGGASIIAMSVHNNSNSVIWLNIEADLTVSGANFYGGFYGVSRSTTSLELNNKYKIAYRTKNGDSALYINGILEASSTETIANPNILNKVQLGGFWTSANTEGNFKIIDAKCYNSGLSNSELQALTQ
jgi:hypothetical protein